MDVRKGNCFEYPYFHYKRLVPTVNVFLISFQEQKVLTFLTNFVEYQQNVYSREIFK